MVYYFHKDTRCFLENYFEYTVVYIETEWFDQISSKI
jgi:hypothetical protein